MRQGSAGGGSQSAPEKPHDVPDRRHAHLAARALIDQGRRSGTRRLLLSQLEREVALRRRSPREVRLLRHQERRHRRDLDVLGAQLHRGGRGLQDHPSSTVKRRFYSTSRWKIQARLIEMMGRRFARFENCGHK